MGGGHPETRFENPPQGWLWANNENIYAFMAAPVADQEKTTR
jgi:hypothetical protein